MACTATTSAISQIGNIPGRNHYGLFIEAQALFAMSRPTLNAYLANPERRRRKIYFDELRTLNN